MTNPIFQNPALSDVKRILSENNLPTDDLSEIDLNHFFACGDTSNPRGVIGLEVFGTVGLLRSFAVDADVQGQGCGTSLLERLEEHANNAGITTLFLLTETAETYFSHKGFESIPREDATESIKKTAEFQGLCPDTATLMRKFL